jgi:chemotaxis protein methyltransferase WspC
MKAIEDLLRDRIGLDATSVGSSVIERSVRLRMKKLGLRETHEYRKHLSESEAEWRELIESVVVSETWFFRDHQAFDAFIKNIMSEWLPRHPLQTLRILSVPCSTGEEPYSLAMALLDAGVLPERFQIHGVDISERALAGAQRAVYGRNAFRGQELSFRDRHFRQSGDGYALEPRVRNAVQFHRLNLLQQELPGGGEPFDFIFCRNLLIYFDGPTQTRALSKLRSALGREGILFVGPAELPLVMSRGFVSMNFTMAFACKRDDSESAPAKPAIPPARTRRAVVTDVVPVAVTQQPAPVHTDFLRKKVDALPHAAHAAPAVVETNLKEARRMADEGKLGEAILACEAHVKQFGPVAEAYYLLGLVADARGESVALELYRKAIYLDPGHYESLLQLSLLLEKQGDSNGARSYRRRADRARKEATAAA